MSGAQSNGMSVLVAVIDDDKAIVDALRFLLQMEGFEVETFLSAAAFLAVLDRVPAALVIVDQNMPGMSGLEMTLELRGLGRAVPVIMLTAALDGALQARALAAGVSHVLAKPPSDDELIDLVRALLDGG